MKKMLIGGGLLAVAALVALAFIVPSKMNNPTADLPADITWLSWDEAIQMAEKNPKKIFVDLYTDWCGWCKKMDATTFKNPEVVRYMNENFYAVKFNAEQQEVVQYKDHTFKYIASGRRGVHELAYSLLDGRLGYPSYVYLDEEQNRITISPGYKDAAALLKELGYIVGNHYQQKTYEEYLRSAGF